MYASRKVEAEVLMAEENGSRKPRPPLLVRVPTLLIRLHDQLCRRNDDECPICTLNGLSIYNLIAGIMCSNGGNPFTDQALLSVLYDIQFMSERLKRRLRIRGGPGGLQSEPVAETLSFMELYRVLEPSHEHPFITTYRCLPDARQVIAESLAEQGILPKRKQFFDRFAVELASHRH